MLDRHIWFDLDGISGATTGDTADGLPPRVEQIGEIRGTGGARLPIRLVRSPVDSEPRWRFSRGTAERIPDWYALPRSRFTRLCSLLICP